MLPYCFKYNSYKLVLKKIIPVLLLLFSGTAGAQFIFTNLQKQNGLSSNETFCSLKDNDGFLWFGTANGLNRYDGSGFKLYTRKQQEGAAPADNAIIALVKKNNREMWAGTRTGLYIFNQETGSFTSIVFKGTNGPVPVQKLLLDNRQRLWIIAVSGLYILQDNTAVPVTEVYPRAAVIKSEPIFHSATVIDYYLDGFWVSTITGLYFIDFKSAQVWEKNNNPRNIPLFSEGQLYSLCPDGNGTIWYSSQQHSLTRFDGNGNIITTIPAWKSTIINYGLYIDSRKRLWVTNYSGSIYVLDSSGRMYHLPEDAPENYKPCNVLCSGITEDNENNLWITGPNGVCKLIAGNFLQNIFTLPNYPTNENYANFEINSIAAAGNGNLWLCKDDGLFLFNSETGISTRYAISATDHRQNRVFDIKFINGEWWCGTGDGIKIFNPVTKKFRPFGFYAKNYPVKNVSAFWIYQDKQGFVWFAVWSDAVYRFDPATSETIRIEEIRSTDPVSHVLTNSLCVYEHTDGKLWFTNAGRGVIIYDPVTRAFNTPSAISNVEVQRICGGAGNTIWLAVLGHGIYLADNNGTLLDSITIKNGLTSSVVDELVTDNEGRLWAGSSDGLQYISIATKQVSKLNIDMGQPHHDLSGPLFIAGDKLYGAVINKLAIVNLPGVNRLSAAVAPLISGIRVFEKNILYTVEAPVVQLRHNENFFSIEYSSLQHNESPSVIYAYQLEGFDRNWVYSNRQQVASYTNVPDGHYTFRVKCTGPDGQWIEKEATVDIRIKPPFWKTAWFFAGCLLLLAAIGWYIYKLNRGRKQKQYIEKTIDYFANSVYGQNSVTEICWDIARNCISQLHFEDCVVYLVDDEKNKLVQKAAYGPKNPKGHEIINPIEIEPGKGIVGTVAATGKSLMIGDTTTDERYIVDDERRFSELAVPILHNSKVIGVIDSEHHRKHFFTAEHLKALNTIAAISANKIAEAAAETLVKENEIKMLEINKLLAESQLMALRAQMNPHFVFNCLNSIQECIVTAKYGEASKYLNKFSKLFRMVLNNSGKKLVTVIEEKEVLALYLELEQMRFEKSFTCSLTVDDELAEDDVLIPSMLVQPFVENALWHGLMHKEGDRILTVSFNKVNDEIFECIIDDNGIGRPRSFALKAEQSKAKRHESMGLAICKDRLDILQKQGYHARLEIIDKTDETGKAAGTKVIIELSRDLVN
jgi:ligand-binding sensor domain-containing protein/putative methionine-R-sulfoxide reductase with GAF domain